MSAEPTLATEYSSGALSKDTPEEFTRLQLLEAWGDPDTQAVLTATGLEPSWRCLEIGAGAGSIARWLASQCTEGSVVAVDTDTRYLDGQQVDRLQWRTGDVRDLDYAPGSFDLIHSRCTFCHLVDREAVIDTAVGWLAPGGWLVLGDPLCLPAAVSIHPAIRRFFGALETAWQAQGTDMSWAQTLPSQLARAGLRDISVLTRPNCLGEKGPYGQLSIANIKQEGGYLVSHRLIEQADLDEVLALCQDPGFMDIRSMTIYAWGRKPVESGHVHQR
ncbi:MAG TPA: methyltransferase domain-containing protein [Jatrophihabitans sp.]|nr:methyltransferase domain-containing protein [Jatrophihabitans sp.]